MTREDPLPEPPFFSESYHAAHKMYGLFSGCLLAFDFIGIDLSEIPQFGKAITNPELAPVALACLILYFGFKYIIEWFQTEATRRDVPVSRVEFWVAHSIGGFALVEFGVRTLLKHGNPDSVRSFGFVSAAAVLLLLFAGIMARLDIPKRGVVRPLVHFLEEILKSENVLETIRGSVSLKSLLFSSGMVLIVLVITGLITFLQSDGFGLVEWVKGIFIRD